MLLLNSKLRNNHNGDRDTHMVISACRLSRLSPGNVGRDPSLMNIEAVVCQSFLSAGLEWMRTAVTDFRSCGLYACRPEQNACVVFCFCESDLCVKLPRFCWRRAAEVVRLKPSFTLVRTMGHVIVERTVHRFGHWHRQNLTDGHAFPQMGKFLYRPCTQV